MLLVDYISQNPYQPAKSFSNDDEDFLVATLSKHEFDVKLLKTKQNICHSSEDTLHNTQITTTNQSSRASDILKIDPAPPAHITQILS